MLERFAIKGVPLHVEQPSVLTGEIVYGTSRNKREGRYMGKPFFRHQRCNKPKGLTRERNLNKLVWRWLAVYSSETVREQA